MTIAEILEYVQFTPQNTNPAILIEMLETFAAEAAADADADDPVAESITITQNGTTTAPSGTVYDEVVVNVPTSQLNTLTITLEGGTAYGEVAFLDGVILNECDNQTRQVEVAENGSVRLATASNIAIAAQNKVNCTTFYGSVSENVIFIEPTDDGASVLLITNSND